MGLFQLFFFFFLQKVNTFNTLHEVVRSGGVDISGTVIMMFLFKFAVVVSIVVVVTVIFIHSVCHFI